MMKKLAEWFKVLCLLAFVGFVTYEVTGRVVDDAVIDTLEWEWLISLRYIFAVLIPAVLYQPTRLFVRSFRREEEED